MTIRKKRTKQEKLGQCENLQFIGNVLRWFAVPTIQSWMIMTGCVNTWWWLGIPQNISETSVSIQIHLDPCMPPRWQLSFFAAQVSLSFLFFYLWTCFSSAARQSSEARPRPSEPCWVGVELLNGIIVFHISPMTHKVFLETFQSFYSVNTQLVG